MTLVTITVQNDDIANTVQSGVSVSVYSTSAVFQTSGTTNGSGVVTFSLADASYDLVFFKQGFSVVQPQRIVVDHTRTNNFLITGHLKVMPESSDPLLSRISGYLMSVEGRPLKNVLVRFDQIPFNVIANNKLTIDSPIEIQSDNTGYLEFNLIRTIKYEASIDGYDQALIVKVADVPAVKLNDLLFPIPLDMSLTASTLNLSLSGGSNSSIGWTVTYSDFNTGMITTDWSSVQINYTDGTIVNLQSTDTNFVITPLKSGTTTITFDRVFNENFKWINPPAFTSDTLVVVVS